MNIYDILRCMKIYGEDVTIQHKQTSHRMNLVKEFDIQQSPRVLEIGCGQGDTTAVLAAAVGECGLVHAIDPAEPHYGGPITLGQARDHLLASTLGKRIQMDYGTPITAIAENSTYDVAVLSHCLFYFSSLEEIKETLRIIRKVAKRICIAEWDLRTTMPEQQAHQLAVQIQALYAAFHTTDANIRHIFSNFDMERLLNETGWTVTLNTVVDASYLDDGQWEIDYALGCDFSSTPSGINQYARTLQQLMNKANGKKSLNSWVLCAE
ncbi:class I SAM-dependent methyltransferase [Solibacillus sp. CAU 1738]|uniref:class I SAM-dependent methyltransferase n=1 Tax=Solibacillus sp. CAU 1738 TaxID=3140363 RepID=UPI0032617DC0